ncbi:MAG: CPP1-like family protein, partial [Halothece sp.]
MSEQSAYEKLGVSEDASFEEIQAAKMHLSEQHQNDSKLLESIEAAYDAIIMDRLKLRQEGKIKVPERIRFPERSSEPPPSYNPVSVKSTPSWLQGLIDNPSRDDILWPAGVFALLSALSAFYPESSIVSLTMALGIFANIYFLNRKEKRTGRAVLLSIVGLLAGIGLGSALYSAVSA